MEKTMTPASVLRNKILTSEIYSTLAFLDCCELVDVNSFSKLTLSPNNTSTASTNFNIHTHAKTAENALKLSGIHENKEAALNNHDAELYPNSIDLLLNSNIKNGAVLCYYFASGIAKLPNKFNLVS
tara:strand:+ start:377 stop:757 length:381 start_codon:yes stop_codon:yes gene_type:complete